MHSPAVLKGDGQTELAMTTQSIVFRFPDKTARADATRKLVTSVCWIILLSVTGIFTLAWYGAAAWATIEVAKMCWAVGVALM